MTENNNNNTSLFASSMHRNPQHQHSDSNLDDESSCATSSYVGNSSAYASTAGDYCSTVDGGAGGDDDYDHSDTTGYGTSTGDATSTGQSGYDDDNVSEYDGASNTVGGMLSGSSSSPRGGMYDESQLMSSVRTRGGNSGGGGGSHGPGAGTPKEELDKVHHYAAKDTRNVRAWRLVVLTMLLITGAMVSTGAYKFLGREQNNDFTTSYYLYANTIHDASQFRMRNMLTSIKGLAETVSATVETTTLTSTENNSNSNSQNEFPMMTIPMFQVQGRHVREQLSAPWIAYSPIVADSVRRRWENYSFEHAHAWMMMGSVDDQAAVVQQQNDDKQKLSHRRALLSVLRRRLQQLNDTNNVSPVIQIGIENGAYVPAPTQSFYAPIWQMDPVPTSLRAMQKINLDTLVEERNVRLLHVVEQVREAVFSEVINVADSIWNGMTTSTSTTTTAGSSSETEEEEEPQSILIQPIYATLDRDVQSINTGTIYAQIPWTNFMVHLLPTEVRGIYALLENSCGQVYTYLLNGAGANSDAASSSSNNNATTATTDDSVVASDGWPLYLGPGDARAERDRIASFDDMQVRVPLHPYVHPALTPNASGHCSYELRLYPSQTLQQTTTSTSVPTWSAVTVGMIFLLMASAFLIYDRFVQRRNSKVVDAAARSNAIVSSLFPSNIRDRLFAASTTSKGGNVGDHGDGGGGAANGSGHFQTNGIKTSTTSNGSSSSKLPQALQKAMNNVSYDSTTPKYRLKNFLNKNGSSEFNAKEAEQEQKQQQGGGGEQSGENGNAASPAATKKSSSSSGSGKKNNRRSVYGHGALGGALSHSDDDDEDVFFQGKPIADLFPETTIIFADIAGFTAWSSVREPSQVFTLLETIYRAFDEIARKRRVFKVETVGDCYVAVTGLPDPDKGHAVAMARFARDCMIRMNSLTKKLEVTLGPDTGDLCMRMGLHSGPVTAGVLRGERSRFQLFGDTMNTASRMESTGMKGRIQVSQETADLLIAAAKAEWVVPREETVVAKGKGEMQTYWLVMNLSDSHHSGASVSGDSIVSVPGADGQQRRKRKKPKQPHQKQQSHDPQEQQNQGENDDANPEEEEEPSNADSRPEVEIKEMDYGDKVEFHPDEHTPEDSAKATSNTNAVKLYELTAAKQARLIDWNVDVMLRLLKQIVARRNAIAKFAPLDVIPGANIAANVAGHALSGAGQALSYVPGAGLAGQAISTVANVPIGLAGQTIGLAGQALSTTGHVANQVLSTTAEAVPIPIPGLGPRKVQRRPSLAMANFTVLEEVSEIITLPKFNAKAAKHQEDPDNVQLRDAVVEQLHDYITNIANMYHGNPFHNFEHASHVTMSVAKLLSRIVAPAEVLEPQEDETGKDNKKKGKKAMATAMHDHTYGITSDPLTQFACVFSALIHDCDHPGVPNAQLCKENSRLALAYKKKSVAEQNSVDLAWELLVDNHYTDLRNTIFATDSEARRFRQLVVNSVMATDIVDKDLKNLRNARWEKAFSESAPADQQESRVDINRKATIVIEHLIQASDVAHTMQHWHIYRKWNERFYMECYLAYKNGRADKDPAEGWYKGELGFYDFYIIPLAKKLKDCGVFGVSSDEYLNYAVRNREEWEIRGHEIVEEMVELAHSKIGKPGNDENGDAPPSPSRRSQRHLLEVVSD